MSDTALEPPDFKDMSDEELWDLINDNRHAISLGVRPCVIIPYLRQARVLTDLDEDEILTCLNFTNRCMRTSHMLDLLRIRGRNGAMALLEGLMIHYPLLYTQVTGRKPSTEPSRFSGLIKYSELTEYLVRAVTGIQKELNAERKEASELRSQCSSLQSQLSKHTQHTAEQKTLQTEHTRLRKSHADIYRDLLKLKDEKCDLYVRYAAAVEEKSEVNIRCRDLTLQVYQLQCELQKAQTETEFQRHRSVKRHSSIETQQLRDEIITLRRKLQRAENITPACQDILTQDLEEARNGRSELAEELRRLQDENETLTRDRNELLEERDCLSLQVQKLTLDCEMFQKKSSALQTQFSELQAERDRAYLSRDEAQTQIACALAEKDTLRAQLVDLQEELFRTQKTQRDPSQERSLSWDSGRDSDSPLSSPMHRPPLRRMNAVLPGCSNIFDSTRLQQYSDDDGFNSTRSSLALNLCSDSLRRRLMDPEFSDHGQHLSNDLFSIFSLDNDFDFLCKDILDKEKPSPSPESPDTTCVSRASAPPFLVRSRPQAVRSTGRTLTLSFQGEALLSQLQVIGGNKTGVFVHTVIPGSPAHSMGISSGAQILEVKFQKGQRAFRMHLEDSTMEEALWALGQVNGPCSLSLQPKHDAYQNFLQQLKTREVASGDSFYVRVNMSLAGGGAGTLSVTCNDILHVTDSRYCGNGYWWANHVHSYRLMDLESGRVPNFYRAQRQLIQAIENLSFQQQAPRRRVQVTQKAVRVVSAVRQGRNPMWVTVEEDNNTNKDEGKPVSVSLMPYTLVTPHHPPVCRPVLLLPSILGGFLHKRLAEQNGFQLCEPETLSECERALRIQRGAVLEECEPNTHRCYTVQGVEKIMKRGTHCVLPLGLDCVRRLHRAEIFPIIIFITFTERSARKLKHKLRQNSVTEAQLLECSLSEEPLLDKLPCLYRTVPPDSWSDTAALLDNLQHIVQEEQRKIVWVEPDLW